jgi:hypothetical protein
MPVLTVVDGSGICRVELLGNLNPLLDQSLDFAQGLPIGTAIPSATRQLGDLGTGERGSSENPLIQLPERDRARDRVERHG